MLGEKDERQEYTHPSYGIISLHRQTGGTMKMFGSSLRGHPTRIALRINEGKREHHLSEDRYYEGKRIIEIHLSSDQFAQLLTTMNTSPGVPCTIDWRQDIGNIEDPPDEEIEIERVQIGFKKRTKKLVSWLKESRDKVYEILDAKTIKKADKETIRNIFYHLIMEVELNMPFTVDQFNEATERLTTAAKAEVESFVTTVVMRTGLDELRKLRVPQLSDKVVEGETLYTAKLGDGTKTHCLDCGEPQFSDSDGLMCEKGHRNSPTIEGQDTDTLLSIYSTPCDVQECRANTKQVNHEFCVHHAALACELETR